QGPGPAGFLLAFAAESQGGFGKALLAVRWRGGAHEVSLAQGSRPSAGDVGFDPLYCIVHGGGSFGGDGRWEKMPRPRRASAAERLFGMIRLQEMRWQFRRDD